MSNPYEPPRPHPRASTRTRRLNDIGWVLLSFEGRIPRRTYWLATLAATGAFYLLVAVVTVVLAEDTATVAVLLLYLPMLWVNLAIQVKRWHDRDKSGLWVFINLVPIVGGLWAFVELGCLRGTEGRNDYGEDLTEGAGAWVGVAAVVGMLVLFLCGSVVVISGLSAVSGDLDRRAYDLDLPAEAP